MANENGKQATGPHDKYIENGFDKNKEGR